MFDGGRINDDLTMIYFSSDHIIAMQQTLVFYDHTLAQQHPAFIGMLRLSLLKAKHGTDILIIKLYIIVLTILPMNVLIGACFCSASYHMPLLISISLYCIVRSFLAECQRPNGGYSLLSYHFRR
jgi:hypothetical protein